MKLTLNISEDRQLVIPPDVIESMHLAAGAPVEVEITDRTPHVFDQAKWDANMAEIRKMAPAFRQRMLDDGYASVDEYMDDIRPPW